MGNIQSSNISDDFILTPSSNARSVTLPPYDQNMADYFLEKINKYLQDHDDKDFLVNCGKRFFPKETLSDGPEAHTLKDVLHKVPSLAKSLYKRGLRKSDVVHLIIGNRTDSYIPVFATLLCQGIVSISVTSISSDTLLSEVKETKPRFVFCTNKTQDKVKGLVGPEIINMDTKIEELIAQGSSLDGDLVPKQKTFDMEDIVIILWSSGTTGKAKGIPLTVTPFWASIQNPSETKGNMLLSCNMAHISGFFFAICLTIKFDTSTNYFIPSDDVAHLGVGKIFDVCKEVSMTSLILSASHCIYMAEMIKSNEVDHCPRFDDVYFITPAGSSTYPTLDEDLRILFNNLLCTANPYGMTESGGGILFSTTQKSNGGVVAKTEIYIRDIETGKRLGPNQSGELMFRRSVPIFKGYLNMPEETAAFFDEDGWCHSGDLFHYSESGEFFFESRMKEMIKSQGSHVYPIELEIIIKEMNSVITEVGIATTEKKGVGTLMGAIIVVKKGSTLDVEEIRRQLNEKVDDFKQLHGPILIQQKPLPRNSMGKLLRSEVMKEYNQVLS